MVMSRKGTNPNCSCVWLRTQGLDQPSACLTFLLSVCLTLCPCTSTTHSSYVPFVRTLCGPTSVHDCTHSVRPDHSTLSPSVHSVSRALHSMTLSREPSTLSLDHCRTAGVRAGVRARGGGTYPILGTLSLDHWTVSADYATPMQRLCNAYATPMQRLTMQSPAAWHYAITCMYAASSGARASRAATGCCAPLPDTAVNELAAFPGISIANPGQVLSASHTSKVHHTSASHTCAKPECITHKQSQ